MAPKFSFSTASGSYSFDVSGNIVICTLNGACCDLVAQRYVATLTNIIHSFQGEPWAYLGNALLHEAATPQAETHLFQAYSMSLQNNCVADAYCLMSAVGISQLKSIRHKAGITLPLSERIFSSVPLAMEQLSKELAKLSKKNARLVG
ncbi:hypothetical protein Q4602_11360 [Paraglaciecola chathamensis]|uniref:hypothetical protein n=1 Tax=Paraglaciecola chathamensis TaxID=368405 RepID=UPI002703C79A|nr:hypothetical protein [Paraglaciecola chathamensis]MDO6840068.1 hypothetical protein [Paraglaciecola chathamensis]